MPCGPPWITTNSGYFFDASKPGGRTTKLWMRLPRLLVNQKVSMGGRSSCATRASLNLVSTSALPLCGAISAISPGELALSQFANIESLSARVGMVRLV